ncbi:hypothetical protein [Flavobacterium subsaxonicum]|uniref:Beta-lactamase-inhibitor-like PepSY-like domain-containing protein n=1 Tax=Flavobacterium subsaxonicum WB 4.1-42 = DSM 21790 TaxID=1121898 RepID=A0A0A2ME02_9FLAO|nr:hypothetical protein [Flavobacterium subsaxonicum]KGO90917.1 hypothetical protein Q766_20865 [Flavobacterium subsaxonicum WB 4.1-42 = DSM 21790]
MKNLFLTAALVLALGANAASVTLNTTSFTFQVNQEKEYKKVDASAVPAAILKEISTKYSGYAITDAYASEDGEYKLVVAKDKKTVTVFYTSTGEFVKEA